MTKRVVLIDDSEIILERIKGVLEDVGLLVTAVTEPSRTAFAGARSPDLILIDVNMPQAFGDDIARFLRESWGLESRIYLYSSLTEEELAERARDSGADGFICKSWGVERLVDEVRRILGLDAPKADADESESLAGALERASETLGGESAGQPETVHHRFAARCVKRREDILELLDDHASGRAVDVERTIQIIAVQLHDYVGESKLLGLDSVASAASSLKAIVESQGTELLSPAQAPLFRKVLDQLTETAKRAAVESPRDTGMWEMLQELQGPADGDAAESNGGGAEDDLELSRRILVVDDSPIVGEVLSMELGARGHEVALATGLAEFNERLGSFEPELIFLDVEMPDINGVELCSHLRHDSKTRALPVILLSGMPEDELAELASRSGANGSLSKQRGMDELINYLDDLMQEIVF